MIDVRSMGVGSPLRFAVTIREGESVSHHEVTMSPEAYTKLSGSAPERVIDAAFRFLLDREPKESILARFDLAVISGYFPEFESALPRYLA
jgi:hypothetical protein